MLLVLALGVGFIALRLASRAWAGVMLFLTLGLLLTAILGAAYRVWLGVHDGDGQDLARI
jgi:hypothetical protein